MQGLPFPQIDPVAIPIYGDFGIRWYALAYLAGILGGWWYARYLARRYEGTPNRATVTDIDDLVPWVVLGIVLGGRVGYVLFYNLPYYFSNPAQALAVWEGGMSFHGGLLGVAVAIAVFAHLRKIHILSLGDIVACVVPIGLFFGRLANFINGELFGRITTVPWAVNFPQGGGFPRHPSQLYEALLEGLILFTILFFAARDARVRARPGTLFGIFLIGYGASRFVIEFVREPDVQIGLIFQYFSMGQLLCLPMIGIGAGLIAYACKRHRAAH